MNRFALALPLLAALVSFHAMAAAPPEAPPALVAEEGRCAGDYTLAPGERRVVACQYKPFRWQPLVQAQSQHLSVDTALVIATRSVARVSLINRSDQPVSGTLIIDVL